MKRIIGLVLVMLAIAGTIGVVRKFAQDKDAPARTQTSGSAAYQQGQKVGKYSAPFLMVLLGIYGLRLMMSSSDAPRPTEPAVRRSPTSHLPPPGDPSLRGGQDTFATNPAMLKLSAWQWLAANPSAIYVALGMAVVGLAVMFIKFPIGAVLLASSVIFLYREIREAKQKFFGGDVCPGIVLSAEQNLVAVYTDLVAAGSRPYPVIQIMKQPLHRMTTGQAYDGMRVATAALYLGDVKADAWRNFWPEVINCVVHDPTEIERVLGSISETEWQMLDACLAQIPEAKLGLHHISPASLATVVAEEAQAAYTSTESGFAPTRPWYKSPVVIIAGAAVGVVAILTIGSIVIVAMNRPKPHTSPFPNHAPAAMQPSATPRSASVQPPPNPPAAAQPAPASPATPNATSPATTMPTAQYVVGSAVEANWAGGWIPGKVIRINPGGHSVMVQLEDQRFPHPIVFSMSQLRPK